MIVKKGKRIFIKRTDHSLKLTDEEKEDISKAIRRTNTIGGKNNE